MAPERIVFDFGMYDAADTLYYLEEGFKVVAVEANPALVRRAQTVLKDHLKAGRLEIIHAAISNEEKEIELTVCGDDLGSSSIDADAVEERTPIGKYKVPGVTTEGVFKRFGVPYYLKVDIEGADHLCVKALSSERAPAYVSFEVGEELSGLIEHLARIGYAGFKLINQTNFREFSNERSLRDRIARKIVRTVGYAEPQYLKRHGRYFSIGHSSGPAPWRSDGQWCSKDQLLEKWQKASQKNGAGVWYDLHAYREKGS